MPRPTKRTAMALAAGGLALKVIHMLTSNDKQIIRSMTCTCAGLGMVSPDHSPQANKPARV